MAVLKISGLIYPYSLMKADHNLGRKIRGGIISGSCTYFSTKEIQILHSDENRWDKSAETIDRLQIANRDGQLWSNANDSEDLYSRRLFRLSV